MAKVFPNDGGKPAIATTEKKEPEEPLLPPGVGISGGYSLETHGRQAVYDPDDESSHTVSAR